METEDILDTIMLVVMLVVGFFITLTAITFIESSSSIKQLEKTALVALDSNEPGEVTMDSDDVILMVAMQDSIVQELPKVTINDNATITFNAKWFERESYYINALWTGYLKDLRGLTVDTFEYTNYGGVYQWNIQLK